MSRGQLQKNIIYALGSIANSAALFLLIPFLVNALTTAEYGSWAIIEVTIVLLTMIYLAGLDTGIMRFYWNTDDAEKRATVVGTGLAAAAIWGIVVTVVLAWLLGLPLFQTNLPDVYNNRFWILLIAWGESTFTIILSVIRIHEKAGTYSALSVAKMVTFILLAVWFVTLGFGVTGALWGRGISVLVLSAIAFVLISRYVRWHVDLGSLRSIVQYGFPLLPMSFAVYLLFASDRFIMNHYLDLQAVAIYTFAYKIGASFDILLNRPFAIDWAPRRFKIAASESAPKQFSQVANVYLWCAIALSLAIISCVPMVYHLFVPEEYHVAQPIVAVILLAYLIYGLSYPLNVGIMIKDKTSYLPVIAWIAALVCVGLNLFSIPRYGYWGAAWSTVIAYAVWTGAIAWMSLKLYHVPYRYGDLALLCITAIVGLLGLWAIDVYIYDLNMWIVLGLKLFWSLVLALISFSLFCCDIPFLKRRIPSARTN